MSDSGPTHKSPLGTDWNKFELHVGALAVTHSRVRGSLGLLSSRIWPDISLRPTGLMIEHVIRQFVIDFRRELFGVKQNELQRYVRQFQGSRGEALKRRVLDAARQVDINPGLLAAVLLFENESVRFWTRSSGEASTYAAGADGYYERRHRIRREIPAARSITIIRSETHTNDARPVPRTITTAYVHASQIVLAVAATLKDKENVMRRLFREEGGKFDILPEHVKFFLARLAFNPGKGFTLRQRVRQILRDRDLLVRQGKRTRRKPQRSATICTALAIHINETIFGSSP